MLPPNAVLPCPSDSARRRHAAHGQTCRVCDSTSGATRDGDLAAYAHRMQQRNVLLESKNRNLRARVTAVADWTRLLEDNQRMAVRLAEADRALKTLLQFPVIRHEAVDREQRRLFPTTTSEGAAA